MATGFLIMLLPQINPNQPLTTALASWTAAAREARRRFVRLPFKGIQRHSKVFKAIQSIFEKKKDSFLCFSPQTTPNQPKSTHSHMIDRTNSFNAGRQSVIGPIRPIRPIGCSPSQGESRGLPCHSQAKAGPGELIPGGCRSTLDSEYSLCAFAPSRLCVKRKRRQTTYKPNDRPHKGKLSHH
jgi:hypothetical protein